MMSCATWRPPGWPNSHPATALVHEAWLRLAGSGRQHWQSRRHFFAAAAEAMRHILIDATATYGNTTTWWDMPSNRHNQGANLSFADGHVEHWRWVVPKVFQAPLQTVLPQEMPDYNRPRSAIRQ